MHACYSVPRAKLFKILRRFYKVDPQLVGAIEALYEDTEGMVRCGGVTSAPFPLRTGLRQGCLLSPLLFAAYMDYHLRQMDEEGREHGVKWQYARDLLWRAARGTSPSLDTSALRRTSRSTAASSGVCCTRTTSCCWRTARRSCSGW